jgi:hypothetical protein
MADSYPHSILKHRIFLSQTKIKIYPKESLPFEKFIYPLVGGVGYMNFIKQKYPILFIF